MHKYMRAIGFSKLKKRSELQKIIVDSIVNADDRSYVSNEDDM